MKRVGAICLAICLMWGLAVPASAAPADIGGKSAVLMDIATGTVLYEKSAHEPLAPASVTKVMTMLLIMEAIDSGRSAGRIRSPLRRRRRPRAAARSI